jgi:sugar O-acyltransferase (sialic acid O-acetyltransferase NeuD family)
MQKPVIIFGTSTLGQSVDLYLTRDSTRDVVAYSATRAAIAQQALTTLHGKPVVPFEEVETLYPPSRYDMFVAVGYAKMNRQKEEFITKAEAKGYTLISHICSSATHWGDVVMGPNVFVFDNNNIQPNVTIGKGVILGRGSNIGHDSVIEDYAFLANHVVLCGHNQIGKFCFVGSNATIMDGVKLAPSTLVGATSFIKRDTSEGDAFVAAATPKSPKKSDEFFDW